jgi:transcription elongation factor Elf1
MSQGLLQGARGPLQGRTFFCPHCETLYSATPSLVPQSEDDAATCPVCDQYAFDCFERVPVVSEP